MPPYIFSWPPPLPGKARFLHHPCNQIQQVADILQAADIRELELDVELLLDGRQQVDLLQAVPVLDVIGAGAAGDLQGVVVKIIAENILYRVQNFLFAQSIAPL